jgi:hypothetical protein
VNLPFRKGTPWFGISTGIFGFFTSQLIANGNASQSEISRAFGVPLVSVKRACKTLRDEGAARFFRPPVPRQGHTLTEQRLQEVRRHPRSQFHSDRNNRGSNLSLLKSIHSDPLIRSMSLKRMICFTE